jgi:hypothetical protein
MKNRIKTVALLAVVITITFGCSNTNSSQNEKTTEYSSSMKPVLTSADVPDLMVANCYACHNPNSSSHDAILAPPFAAVKKHYLQASEDRTEFIDRMTAFVYNPNKEAALMKGPVGRFGLMPKTALNEEEIRTIVAFIYDNEIQEPAWFGEHEMEKHGKGKHKMGKNGEQ